MTDASVIDQLASAMIAPAVGTIEIGGDPVWAAREAAEALIRETDRQDADFDFTVVGVVSGAAETECHRETALTEAAVEGLMEGSAQIGPEAEQGV